MPPLKDILLEGAKFFVLILCTLTGFAVIVKIFILLMSWAAPGF